jgi:ankyrin repeat protein
MYAAIHGSESIVKALLAIPQVSVNFQNERGQCALWCPALQGFTEIVEDLLQRPDIRVDLPERKRGLTPLAAAVAMGRATIVKRLIQTGRANVNAPDRGRCTPIFLAIARQDSAILEILLADDRLDLSWQDSHGRTPLIYSVSKGQKAMTKLLLGHPNPYVDIRDSDGRMALWYAVEQVDGDTVQLLLDRGSHINFTDIDGLTPLHLQLSRKTCPWCRSCWRIHAMIRRHYGLALTIASTTSHRHYVWPPGRGVRIWCGCCSITAGT